MPEIDRIPSLAIQIALVGRMRWKLFRNSSSNVARPLGGNIAVVIGLTISAFALGAESVWEIFCFFVSRAAGLAGWPCLFGLSLSSGRSCRSSS